MKFGVFISAQQPRSDDSVAALSRGGRAGAAGASRPGSTRSPPAIITCRRPTSRCRACRSWRASRAKRRGWTCACRCCCLAMLNPVQTAEEVASLDIMSEGRVVFGIGIGYRDVEYEAFGDDRRASGCRACWKRST